VDGGAKESALANNSRAKLELLIATGGALSVVVPTEIALFNLHAQSSEEV